MAKLIIVCVIAMLAVASATFIPKMAASFNEEAMTCSTNTCVVSGGDCLSTDTDNRYCPQNEYTNKTYDPVTRRDATCNCRTIAQFLAAGATCSPTAITDQCGPYMRCAVAAGGDTADYKCYGMKMIGDSCTVGSLYECMAPRVCSSAGVCVATLASGAMCYNATSQKSTGQCLLTQYCPKVYSADQVCTDFLAAGATCTDSTKMCLPYTQCGLTSTFASRTCDRWVFGNLATGAAVTAPNTIGQLQCASYLMNATSGNCVDYDTELAKWNAAFPTPASVACTYDTDCNLPGVTLATCTCTAKATGATPYCLLGAKPSVGAAPVIAINKQDGIMETGWKAGCENPTPAAAMFVNNAAYCSSKWSSTYLAAVCPAVTATASTTFSCYDDTLGLCNGASALQSSVVMTMIVALVAFFTTQ